MGWHRVVNQMSPYLQAQRLQTPCLVLDAHRKSPPPRMVRPQRAPRAEQQPRIKARSAERGGRLSSEKPL